MSKYEYEWTDDMDVRLYYDGEEITDEPIENHGDAKAFDSNGVPRGVKGFAANSVADQSVPDEQKLQEGIERLAAITANQFQERSDNS